MYFVPMQIAALQNAELASSCLGIGTIPVRSATARAQMSSGGGAPSGVSLYALSSLILPHKPASMMHGRTPSTDICMFCMCSGEAQV